MPRSQHYTPEIRLFLVSALYHEAKHQKLPMTKLVNQLLEQSLKNSVGWQRAQEALNNPENHSVAPPGK